MKQDAVVMKVDELKDAASNLMDITWAQSRYVTRYISHWASSYRHGVGIQVLMSTVSVLFVICASCRTRSRYVYVAHHLGVSLLSVVMFH